MSDKWKELRAKNIGGSDIACLFDEGYMSSFTIWHLKKNNIEPDNFDNDERVQAGNFLEAGIISWANHKWNMRFYQPRVYVTHPLVKGMACTPDAFIEGQQDVIAQIKNVDGLRFAMEWEYDGDLITKAPLHIILQCQHELACCGAKENWLIVCVGGNRLYRMVVNRDEEIISILENKVTEFWKSIEENKQPHPDYRSDGKVIRAVKKTGQYCDTTDLSDDRDLEMLLEELKHSIYQRKSFGDIEEAKKNKLIHLYGEYTRIKCNDFIVNIKPDINGHIRVMIGTEKVAI